MKGVKPNVLILIDTHRVSGPAKGLFQLLELRDPGKFDYILSSFGNSISSDFSVEAVRRGLNHKRVEMPGRFSRKALFELRSLIRAEGMNIIQSHGYKTHLYAFLLSKWLDIPWIAFHHGWTSEDRKVELFHSLDRITLRYPTIAVGVSEDICSTLRYIRGARGRVELIENAIVPPPRFGDTESSFVPEEGRLAVACVGRLSHEKGQDILLEALRDVHKALPPFVLYLFGEGPARKNLEEAADKYSLREYVRFPGHTSHLQEVYPRIDLLILPSRSEGLPNVLLEGYSYGVPAVAADVGAVRRVIPSNELGWIVKPLCSAALGESIADALQSPERRKECGERGRQYVLKEFSAQRRCDAISRLYEDIILRKDPVRQSGLLENS
jgi:glycosyltransferase involved in cell wall biosynthesis